MQQQKIIKRYSTAFKQKVVNEIEAGTHTVSRAKKIYDITGGATIQHWIRSLGKSHLLATVLRIQMKDEHDILKKLEHEKRQLESALAHAHLKIICLESTIEAAEEDLGIVIKKKSDIRVSPKPSQRSQP